MERGPTFEEAAKTPEAACPGFLTGPDAVRADLLMLLRAAFADGALNEAARAALCRAALVLGVGEDQAAAVMEPLERADAGVTIPFARLSRKHRAGLLRRALEVAAHDDELMARGDRLRARLMALLDLSPGDVADPEAV